MSHTHLTPLDQLLRDLELTEYYPSKLTIDDVFRANIRKKQISLSDVKWHILSKILSNDFTIRDEGLRKILESVTTDLNKFHPQDVLITLLLCSSPLFRKHLINNLFMCKLAIPFIWATDRQLGQGHVSYDTHCKLSLGDTLKRTFFKGGKFSKSRSYSQAQALINSRKGGLGIEQTLECYTWPLNFVSIDGKTSSGRQIDGFLSNEPFQVVSFIKVGKTEVSKSEVINHLITQQPHHNIFYTKNCALGHTQRSISDGTIEASCHIPSEEFDCFGNLTVILNLRGDAKYYPNQIQILKNISHVLVIFLNLTEIDPNKNRKGSKRLREVCRDDKTGGEKSLQTLFVIESPSYSEKSINKLFNILNEQIIANERLKSGIISIRTQNGQNKGLSEISMDVKMTINTHFELLQTDLSSMSDEIAQIGTCCKEHICSYDDKCSTKANTVFDLLDVNCFQLQELWLEYSKFLKKMYQEKLLEKKKELKENTHQLLLRQYQIVAEKPPKIVCQMIRELCNMSENPKYLLSFVIHLGNCFDKRSRKVLPRAFAKSQKLAKKRHETNQKSCLGEEIEQANKEINFSTFGIQNIIRDVAHIYECVKAVKSEVGHVGIPTQVDKQLLGCIEKCPKIFAKLLAMGHLLELIDGDAFNMPTSWLQEVLKCLKDEIGSKKRLLILSILGLQSSGKSTLLNVMFGLQFAVSAGRCTKGVFVALVPVPKKQYPFDYIFVVDAEGLRSPESGGNEYEHDNQLATFVVGVGDITIINVLGETTSEIGSVLEIVVHAFLRLKQVQKNFQLRQSCIFVHQNVQGSIVVDKMATAREKFIESLNRITKQAAEYEKVSDISTFNDVIRLDSDKDIIYFPGLWCGSPPMSPVSPIYSERVVKLKNSILDDIVKYRKTFFTVSDIAERMQSLWDGILSEDFVFTYRNGIELKASRKAEEKYFGIKRDLEYFVFEYLKTDVPNALRKCKDEQSLDEEKNTITGNLKDVVQRKIDSLIEKWKTFVRSDQLSDILQQFQQPKIEHLQKYWRETLIKSAEKEIDDVIDHIRIDIKQNILLQPDEMATWKTLADKFVKTFLSMGTWGSINDRIEDNFEKLWAVQTERSPRHETDAPSIREEINAILFEYFPADSVYLRKEIERDVCTDIGHDNSESIAYSESEYSHAHFNEIMQIKNKVLKNIDKLQENKICGRFSIGEVKRILDGVNKEFATENMLLQKKHGFCLDNKIKAKLMLQAGKTLIVRFQDMHRMFEEQYGLNAKNKQFKKAALHQFKEMVQMSMTVIDPVSIQQKIPRKSILKEDEDTAKIFASVIMKQVKGMISIFLPQDVVNEVMGDFSHTKYNLITEILIDLADKEVFEHYYSYIHNTEAFVLQYVMDYVDNKMFNVEKKYAALAKKRISTMVNEINECLEIDTDICQNSLLEWTKVFLNNINATGKFCLTQKHFSDSRIRYIYSLKQFCEYLKKHVAEGKEFCANAFAQETAKDVAWEGCDPHKEVFKRLWGCPETCPFCSEPCEKTEEHHTMADKYESMFSFHSCIQHRPDGISGWRDMKTKILSLDVCNVNVQSDEMFECNIFRRDHPENTDSTPIYHPYRQYKDYAQDWEIAPDCKLTSSPYWAWFLCTFKQKIIKTYNVRWPTIPTNWENISKSEAIASLRITYL